MTGRPSLWPCVGVDLGHDAPYPGLYHGVREVMLLVPTHYGHSYLMHKISNNVLIIFKRCYFVYSSLLLQNMQLLLMYNLYSCTTISLIVIPSENLEVILLFTVCYDGCITYQIINQLSSAYYAIVCNFHCNF